MMQRGQKVQYVGDGSGIDPYAGKHGKVMLLPEDESGYDGDEDDEVLEVYVKWNNPFSPPAWVNTEFLEDE
jgi:hypothetical protein